MNRWSEHIDLRKGTEIAGTAIHLDSEYTEGLLPHNCYRYGRLEQKKMALSLNSKPRPSILAIISCDLLNVPIVNVKIPASRSFPFFNVIFPKPAMVSSMVV